MGTAAQTQVIRNARVLVDDTFRDDLALVIEHGRIAALLPEAAPSLAAGADTVDLHGGWLLPGFIDVQVNGGGGALFNNTPDVQTLRTIARAHRRFGTTALLPTLISDDAAVMALLNNVFHQSQKRLVFLCL